MENKFDKMTILFNNISILNNEIKDIEDIAMNVANGNIKAKINLLVEDLRKVKDNLFDKDGSLINKNNNNEQEEYHMRFKKLGFLHFDKPKDFSFKYDISEEITLKVLAIVLNEKNNMKNSLLNELTKINQ
jgi:hypothetical protein